MLLDPERLWQWVARQGERGAILGWLLVVALVGGLGVAAATEIGVRHFHADWHAVAGYAVQRDRNWTPFFVLWGVSAALPIVQGLCGAFLLPMYGRPRMWAGGIAVAVIGSIPVYLAGLSLVLLPGILIVCVAFLVSCGWWGSGARVLLGVPLGEAADHVVASLVTSGALLFLLSASLPMG